MVAADGVVQAVGVMLGVARDSFGVSGGANAGLSPTSGSSPVLAAAFFGSGQTAAASSNQSIGLNSLFSGLSDQDVAAHATLQGALASQGAGLGNVNDAIDGAFGDVTGLAPGSNTNGGLLNLVNALASRLEQAWQALTTGNADSSTHAAASAQNAAGYSALTGVPTGTVAPTGGLTSMGGLSTAGTAPSGMTAMQVWVPAAAAASTAAATTAAATTAQAATAQQAAAKSTATPATTTSATKQVPTKVQDVLNRANKYKGTPYSYGGGTPSGPGYGIDQGAHTKGFDCSSFVQMAYWPYIHLPRTADAQALQGTTIAFNNIQPGDLIFSEQRETNDGGAGHVEMATGYGKNTKVISAAHTGTVIQEWPKMDPTAYTVKRLLH